MIKPENVDAYIESFPPETQKLLQHMRTIITKAAPYALEVISYGMPAFKTESMLVYFAAHTKHIGFYPTGSAIEKCKTELSKYKSAKGSVQFPFDQPLPLDLIANLVRFRLKENMEKAAAKKTNLKAKNKGESKASL